MADQRLRGLADPVGFAHLASQMDRETQRIAVQDGVRLDRRLADHGVCPDDRWRMAIAPHDDYAYAGFMYPLVLVTSEQVRS